MPTTDPVVVPVQLDLTQAQTALGALGQNVQTARGALGSGASSATGPGAAAPAAGPSSLGGLLREMQALESSVGRLVQVFDRLARTSDPNAPASHTGVTSHVRVPRGHGGGAGQPPPDPNAPLLDVSERLGHHIGMSVKEAVGGLIGIAGIGIGVGAAVRDVGQWYSSISQLSGEAVRGTLLGTVSGGRAGPAYHALMGGFQAEPRNALEAMVSPDQKARLYNAMVEGGVPTGSAAANMGLLGSVGMAAGGRADAALPAMMAGFGTYRSERIPELLGTLVMIARDQGLSSSEMLRQFVGIRGVMESRQGQYARSPEMLAEYAGFQAMLTGLPGGVGEGQGGVMLAEKMASYGAPGSGGIAETIGMRAYIDATGKSPFTSPKDRIDYIRWSKSPTGMAARMRMMRETFGPDVAALILSEGGRQPIEPWVGAMHGDLSVDRVKQLADHDSLMDPQKGMSRGLDDLLHTLGGEALTNDALRQRNVSEEDKLIQAIAGLERLKAQNPGKAAIIEAIIGILPFALQFGGPAMMASIVGIVGGIAGGAGIAASLGGAAAAIPEAGAAAGLGAGAPAAAASAAAVAGRTAWRGVPWALPAIGVAEAGKDIFDMLGVFNDPTNANDMVAGVAGVAVAGIGLGLTAPVSVPATLGVLATGYGMGKGGLALWNALGGGSATGEGGKVNEQFAVEKLMSLGWSRNEAAAAVGNWIMESGLNPNAKGQAGELGIMQWLGPRKSGLMKYASSTGRSWTDPSVQIEWAAMERSGASRQFGGTDERAAYRRAFAGGGSASTLGARFAQFVERPASSETYGARAFQASRIAGDAGEQPAATEMAGGGLGFGTGGEVHVYIHMDPSFPGRVTAHGTPGVIVRRAQ